MADNDEKNFTDRLSEAYETMLERVRGRLREVESDAEPAVHNAIERAKETATELGELSREEAEKLGVYLRKDLEEAADYVSRSGRELGDWLRFDVQLIERGLADLFFQAVDRTRIELNRFASQAETWGEWHTGEVTVMGTLQCKECGELLHFHKPGRIPPCPKCHGTRFRRVTSED